MTRPPGLCSGAEPRQRPVAARIATPIATFAQRGPGGTPGIAIDFIDVDHAAALRATRAGAEPRQRRHSAPRAPAPYRSRNGGRGRTPAMPRRPRRPARRGQPAGPAAGGRRARAGRRADSSIAGDRHVRALPRAERRRGSVPFRTGGRRHPAAPWGWEDLDSWLVPRLRAQAAPARHLAGRPRGDRPARQHYPRI